MQTPDIRAAALQTAAKTGHDWRSALNVFEGRPVRLSTRLAIEKAATELGLSHLLPQAETPRKSTP